MLRYLPWNSELIYFISPSHALLSKEIDQRTPINEFGSQFHLCQLFRLSEIVSQAVPSEGVHQHWPR